MKKAGMGGNPAGLEIAKTWLCGRRRLSTATARSHAGRAGTSLQRLDWVPGVSARRAS